MRYVFLSICRTLFTCKILRHYNKQKNLNSKKPVSIGGGNTAHWWEK